MSHSGNNSEHIYQQIHLTPMTVEEINGKTRRARALPPSGDQTHVLVPDGEDPWVIAHEGRFYYCTVDRAKRKILVSQFTRLEDMAGAGLVQVWPGDHAQTPDYLEIWSPELQRIDGEGSSILRCTMEKMRRSVCTSCKPLLKIPRAATS